MRIAIEGGRVLLPTGKTETVTVTIADGSAEGTPEIGGRIIGIGHAIAANRRWHVPGLIVAPGIVDLHGDAFERRLMPRPGVVMPDALALQSVDRELLANGITTAYHGVTLSWEPGLRSLASAAALIDAVARLRPVLACDTRIHLRFEILNLAAVDTALAWIAGGGVDLLAFNDHSQDIVRALATGKGATLFNRSGLDRESYAQHLDRVLQGRADVPESLARLAHAAALRGLPLASHDDDTPETRGRYRALGCRLCEFPLDETTAASARSAGDTIILGAPNVVRGASHAKRLSAREAVGERLCTVLTSDYYYPALPAAPFRLADEGIVDLATAWRLVSTNPAAAAGLDDRGTVALGQRADLVLIDDRGAGPPRIAATIVGGRIVHLADAALATALAPFPGGDL